jgi:transcriptional regulator with XRE-family HTH domain/quercetin dioxygenase-like cupin family protein
MNMKSQQTRHRDSAGRDGAKGGGGKAGAKAAPAARPKRSASRKSAEAAGASVNGAVLGGKLRAERQRQGITVREMARRVDVSPSLVSQIERGLVTPSVGTLWSMTAELGLVMDGLFIDTERSAPQYGGPEHSVTEHGGGAADLGGPAPRPDAAAGGAAPGSAAGRRAHTVVQRGHNRQHIRLAGGVVWERLSVRPDDEVEFLYVRYEAGAESCPENSFFRHGGREYAYLLEGRLGLQIGFDRYELSPGDSVSFESHNPHRLWTIGDEPATAIWVIISRTNDHRPHGDAVK